MYRPKRSKDFFTYFSFSYFLCFLSLFFRKKKQITTFCAKLIMDFGHLYRISGNMIWIIHFGKKKTKKQEINVT